MPSMRPNNQTTTTMATKASASENHQLDFSTVRSKMTIVMKPATANPRNGMLIAMKASPAMTPRTRHSASPRGKSGAIVSLDGALEHGRGPKQGGHRGLAHGAMRRGATPVTSVLPRSQQLRRMPHYRLPSMLEYRERLGDFGNRLFRAFRIDDDNVSRAADGKAIVAKIEQPR